MTSAMVERDFSQYAAITAVCTSNLKKPMLQNRMFSRCNKDDYERVDMKALLAEVESND